MTVATPRSAGISARHPLAPLTVAEIGTGAKLALAATGHGARLVYVTLAEPEKADVLGWDGTPLPRAALAVTYERAARTVWMITVMVELQDGRSRRMVVSFVATVGNYDYGFYWYFYLDGTIQAEVKLTGIIQTQAVAPGTRVPYANPVTPELAGPHHQHMFSYRLDMCLDGPANSVYEVDAVPVPAGPDNPYGNAFAAANFPVMPVEYAGFTLKPFGFFDANPAIDLAAPSGGHCHP
jgi:Cu2+-containing amine oxidase